MNNSKPELMRWNDPMGVTEVDALLRWINANGGEAVYEPGASEFNVIAASEGRPSMTRRPARIAVRTSTGWAYAAPGDEVVKGEITSDFGEWVQTGAGMAPKQFREFTVSRAGEAA